MRRLLLTAALIGVPALAQMDFSSEWAPVQDEDNTGNPYIGEWLGIPMSAAGRLRVEAWDASYMTLPEWQCRPHGAMYISRGPSQVRIWKEVDPVYLTRPFVRSYQFKKQADASGWETTACLPR